jgi:polysaccharide pyruvyl transferase WcaK-like protein
LRVGFWGNFGTHNLGNECTLHAMLTNSRRRLPRAELLGICNDPDDTESRHQIAAFPIAREPDGDFMRLPERLRWLRRPAWELGDWLRVMRMMRTIDMLVMTGTGMITDTNEGMMGMPYQMFKWVVAARLARSKVKFVSVGAEKLTHPVQLFFLGWSLRLSQYRSYRDPLTQERAGRFVRRASNDPIYPDLAFSLPESLTRARESRAGAGRSVAVGIYAVESGPDGVRSYVEEIGKFVLWLLEHGYRTRIVIGDVKYDTAVLADLRTWLTNHNALHRVIDEPVASFEDLLLQLSEADLVVATRFHNVLLAILLGKPVVSISHMDKNDALMAAMGLSAYCRGLDGIREDEIVALFEELEKNAQQVRSLIQAKLELFRAQLEEQYSIVFGELAESSQREKS